MHINNRSLQALRAGIKGGRPWVDCLYGTHGIITRHKSTLAVASDASLSKRSDEVSGLCIDNVECLKMSLLAGAKSAVASLFPEQLASARRLGLHNSLVDTEANHMDSDSRARLLSISYLSGPNVRKMHNYEEFLTKVKVLGGDGSVGAANDDLCRVIASLSKPEEFFQLPKYFYFFEKHGELSLDACMAFLRCVSLAAAVHGVSSAPLYEVAKKSFEFSLQHHFPKQLNTSLIHQDDAHGNLSEKLNFLFSRYVLALGLYGRYSEAVGLIPLMIQMGGWPSRTFLLSLMSSAHDSDDFSSALDIFLSMHELAADPNLQAKSLLVDLVIETDRKLRQCPVLSSESQPNQNSQGTEMDLVQRSSSVINDYDNIGTTRGIDEILLRMNPHLHSLDGISPFVTLRAYCDLVLNDGGSLATSLLQEQRRMEDNAQDKQKSIRKAAVAVVRDKLDHIEQALRLCAALCSRDRNGNTFHDIWRSGYRLAAVSRVVDPQPLLKSLSAGTNSAIRSLYMEMKNATVRDSIGHDGPSQMGKSYVDATNDANLEHNDEEVWERNDSLWNPVGHALGSRDTANDMQSIPGGSRADKAVNAFANRVLKNTILQTLQHHQKNTSHDAELRALLAQRAKRMTNSMMEDGYMPSKEVMGTLLRIAIAANDDSVMESCLRLLSSDPSSIHATHLSSVFSSCITTTQSNACFTLLSHLVAAGLRPSSEDVNLLVEKATNAWATNIILHTSATADDDDTPASCPTNPLISQPAIDLQHIERKAAESRARKIFSPSDQLDVLRYTGLLYSVHDSTFSKMLHESVQLQSPLDAWNIWRTMRSMRITRYKENKELLLELLNLFVKSDYQVPAWEVFICMFSKPLLGPLPTLPVLTEAIKEATQSFETTKAQAQLDRKAQVATPTVDHNQNNVVTPVVETSLAAPFVLLSVSKLHIPNLVYDRNHAGGKLNAMGQHLHDFLSQAFSKLLDDGNQTLTLPSSNSEIPPFIPLLHPRHPDPNCQYVAVMAIPEGGRKWENPASVPIIRKKFKQDFLEVVKSHTIATDSESLQISFLAISSPKVLVTAGFEGGEPRYLEDWLLSLHKKSKE